MLQTTELDLQELVRSLFEHLVDRINDDHGDLASFTELVRDEEAVYIWFAGEDEKRRGARYTAVVSWNKQTEALDFEVQVDEAFSPVFFRLASGQGANRRMQVADLGNIDRAAVKTMFDHLAGKGYLNDFFYQVRTSTAVIVG